MRMDLHCGTTWPCEAWLSPYEGLNNLGQLGPGTIWTPLLIGALRSPQTRPKSIR